MFSLFAVSKALNEACRTNHHRITPASKPTAATDTRCGAPPISAPPRPCRRDGGSVAVEVVVLAPALIVLLLFVVAVGRAGGVLQQVHHAAAAAARAASTVDDSHMANVARTTAAADLAGNGVNCASLVVGARIATVSTLQPRTDAVTVTVSCAIDVQGLALLGVASRRVTGRSTEVVDRFRADR